jgi:hypothetical protein
MAIQLEFINFIVPIEIIIKKYPGGWDQCLKDHRNLIGGRVWFDEYLFRDGAMNPMGIGSLVEEWQSRGFHTHNGNNMPNKWVDVCVVEALFGGATLPCDWIEIEGDVAFYRGTPKGEVIGREQFSA